MSDIPLIEPGEIVAGDYIQWRRQLSDYPAGTWTLTYTLINASNKYTITAANSGGEHLVTVTTATSAGYAAGVYQWQAAVVSGAQKYTIASGEMTIKPSFAAASTLDTRSQAKRTLDAIESEIEARATGGMTAEYSIGNRSLKKCTVDELIKLRDKYKAIYTSEQASERISKGLGGANRILVRI